MNSVSYRERTDVTSAGVPSIFSMAKTCALLHLHFFDPIAELLFASVGISSLTIKLLSALFHPIKDPVAGHTMDMSGRFFTFVRSTPFRSASFRFASFKSAFVRFAPSRLADLRSAQDISEHVKFAPRRSAAVKIAPCRSDMDISAFAKLAYINLEYLMLAPDKSAPSMIA